MKIRTSILAGVIVLLLLTGALGALSFLAAQAERERARSADQLMSSLKLAGQLRQSSDDLTRMARMYAATGDAKYRGHFMRILAVRNGDQPRPPDYGGIFWDRVLSGARELDDEGEPVALRELMRRMGFTEAEFALLKKAEDNSNDLVDLEEIAMHAVVGRFADDDGKFTRDGPPDFDLARSIMFGSRYHAAKEIIMEPIDSFNRQIEERLRAEMNRLHLRSLKLANLQVLLAVLTGATMLAGLFQLRARVLAPLARLTRNANALRCRNYSARLDIRRQDEMGELGQTFNEMAEAIDEDIGNRDRAAAELREARDAAKQANRAKSEFLANMSHEIRTPMNGIMGMSELLMRTKLTRQQGEFTQTVYHCAETLLRLLNDILDFSKIEAGKLDLEIIAFPLRDTLGDTMKLLAARAAEKGLELAHHVPPDIPDALVGDPGRLRQIIINLAGNAIKFTAEGEVVVGCRVVRQDSTHVEVEFDVTDTGVGIPADKQDKIFESFGQADASTTRQFGGTGLGLTISRRLVELMDGRIWVDSIEGKGSSFRFTVRLGIQRGAEAFVPQVHESMKDMPVLVVEDNDTNRMIFREMLASWQMKPICVDSGAEALARVAEANERREPFPLMILDCMMPGMDGFEVAEKIRADPVNEKMCILMLSSANFPDQQRRARFVGVSRSLTKPVKQSDLLNAITRATGAIPITAAAPEDAQMAAGADDGPPLRILMAEDGLVNQRVASELLRLRRHHVTVARNGLEAVGLSGRQPFDLILMDIHMPEMDGFQATKKIREREREKDDGRRIPIIALTANAMKGDRERCLTDGMDDYVSKPIRADDLYAAVRRNTPKNPIGPPAADWRPDEPETFSLDRDQSADQPERADESAEDAGGIVDPKAALENVGGSEEILLAMIDSYYEETFELFVQLRSALETGDAGIVERTAHTIKSSVSMYGAEVARVAASELERLGKAGDLASAPALVERLRNELNRLHLAIEQQWKKPAPSEL